MSIAEPVEAGFGKKSKRGVSKTICKKRHHGGCVLADATYCRWERGRIISRKLPFLIMYGKSPWCNGRRSSCTKRGMDFIRFKRTKIGGKGVRKLVAKYALKTAKSCEKAFAKSGNPKIAAAKCGVHATENVVMYFWKSKQCVRGYYSFCAAKHSGWFLCNPNGRVSHHPRRTHHRNNRAGHVQLVSQRSRMCMDVPGGTNKIGTQIQQSKCEHNNQNQHWKLIRVGSSFMIRSRRTGKCLDLAGGSHKLGAKIQQWNCNKNNANQLWDFVKVRHPWYMFRSKKTGKCIDLKGGSRKIGAKLQQHICNPRNPNVLWRSR